MRIPLADFIMACDEYGSGRPLLLIHGFPLNRRMWQPQISSLSEVARLIVPDLRGFGESEAGAGPYSMDTLAEDCCRLLDALDIKQPAVICGLSMGGYVALAFYRRYPERVAALILVATRAGDDSPEMKARRDEAMALARQGGAKAILESMLPRMFAPGTYTSRPEVVEFGRQIMETAAVNGLIGALAAMKARPDSTPLLGQIRVPTLILHGAEDQITPIREAEKMRDGIPGAQLKILPAAGHLLNLEQPDLFNQTVRAFLQTLE